ncbi:polymorphic toxin type 47 domain-containing protein, partial [Chryseobacterium luquanense]
YDNPYKYNAKEFDSSTGYYYYGARYYDPKRSFWLSIDPLADITVSPYAYVWNDPVNFADPTGMMGERIGGDGPGKPKKVDPNKIYGPKGGVLIEEVIIKGIKKSNDAHSFNGNIFSGIMDGATEASFETITFKGIRDIASISFNTIRSFIDPSARNSNVFGASTLCITGDCVESNPFNNLEPGLDIAVETFDNLRNENYYEAGKNIGTMAIVLGSIFLPEGKGGTGNGLTGGKWKFNAIKDVDMRGGATHIMALEETFKRTGLPRESFQVTKWGKDVNGKSIPVEYQGPGGASVNMDIPVFNNVKAKGILGEGPHQPHVGYQTSGRKASRIRGHIFIDNVPATR